MDSRFVCVASGIAVALLAGCQSTPAGARGPGQHYAVSRSYNGFTGTQQLRFGAYRVGMEFDAPAVAKSNLKRGLLGALAGCRSSGCGLPRSPESMPSDFDFSGPAGSLTGRCAPAGETFQCTLGDVQLRFVSLVGGFGAWEAQTPFGPLRIESSDIADDLGRRIEWRVIDHNEDALAVIADRIPKDEERDPSFTVWLADGHPDDQQALAKVAGTLLAYAWHSSGE